MPGLLLCLVVFNNLKTEHDLPLAGSRKLLCNFLISVNFTGQGVTHSCFHLCCAKMEYTRYSPLALIEFVLHATQKCVLHNITI